MNSINERFSFATRQEEQHLLARARAGNPEAFEMLVMPHRHMLLRLAQRILRNREDAEDAVQTTILQALRNLHAFQGRSRFSVWLTRVAINVAFMQLRSSRRKSEISLDEEIQGDGPVQFHPVEARPGPEHECSAREAFSLFNRALDRLKPHYLEVLELRHLQELSGKEVARILDVPVNTVKARLHRARAILMRNVEPVFGPRRRPASAANSRAAVLVPRTAART